MFGVGGKRESSWATTKSLYALTISVKVGMHIFPRIFMFVRRSIAINFNHCENSCGSENICT